MGINKRAIFYTIDALILLSIILAAVFLLSGSQTQTPAVLPNTYLSEDIMRILTELEMNEINQTWVTQKMAEGAQIDENVSVLTQLGDFWSKDNITLAQELAQVVFADLTVSKDFGIWIGDEQVFTSNLIPTTPTNAIRSWRIVSGIEKTKPFKGHVANARATNIIANGTKTITVSPQGAGWEDGEGYITKYFNLSNITINSAELRLSVHADVGDVSAGVNNCSFVYNDFTWLFGTEGNVGYHDVTSCLGDNWNNITIQLNNDAYSAHTHPGTQLVINFSETVTEVVQSTTVSERYYFDNTLSDEVNGDGSGAWQTVPFFIPTNATDVSVGMQVVGKSIRDYHYPDNNGCDIHLYPSFSTRCNTFRDWDSSWSNAEDNDYLLFLNSQDPIDVDDKPTSDVTYTYDNADLSPYLQNGTNLVIVYFNNYGDYVWGDGDTQIYSDQVNYPDGSSFIEVNYTLSSELPQGLIEISQVQEFGGVDDNDKQTSFTYPSQAQQKGDIKVNTIQQYSYLLTGLADTNNPPTTQMFVSPAARAIPSEIYVDNSVFDLDSSVDNYVRIYDSNGNDILDISSVEYSFYMPSYVGFGDVFTTQEDAQNDAIARLDTLMSGFISSDSVLVQNQSVTNVSTLWGPVVIEVRSWN